MVLESVLVSFFYRFLAILNVFPFLSFTQCETYLPTEIGLWKVVLVFIFSPPALPPDCFLWAQGPSQPFRPCEDAVLSSCGVTVVVTQSFRKAAALPKSNSPCWGKLSPSGSGLLGLSLGMSWARKTPESFCLPRASFSALPAKTRLKACVEAPWRVWSSLGEALETRTLYSGSPSPGEEASSWVSQTASAQGLHQYLGALRLGWVLAGPSASGNLCSHAERSKEHRSERGSNAGTPSLPP